MFNVGQAYSTILKLFWRFSMTENKTNIPGSGKKRGPYNRSKYIDNVKEPRCTTWHKKSKLSGGSIPTNLDDDGPSVINQDLDNTTVLGKMSLFYNCLWTIFEFRLYDPVMVLISYKIFAWNC